jgi:hypothetical protein
MGRAGRLISAFVQTAAAAVLRVSRMIDTMDIYFGARRHVKSIGLSQPGLCRPCWAPRQHEPGWPTQDGHLSGSTQQLEYLSAARVKAVVSDSDVIPIAADSVRLLFCV